MERRAPEQLSARAADYGECRAPPARRKNILCRKQTRKHTSRNAPSTGAPKRRKVLVRSSRAPSARAADQRPTASSVSATEREGPEFEHVSEKANEQAPQQTGTQTCEQYNGKALPLHVNMNARESKRQRIK